MIELTFRSGRTIAYRRTDEVLILNRNDTTERRRVSDLSPGVLVVGLGLVLWITRDGERTGLPPRDVSSLPVRRMEVAR